MQLKRTLLAASIAVGLGLSPLAQAALAMLVEFTVATDGSVSSARVVRANPPRVFDREAVAAVKRWRFQPVGNEVTTRRTIGFKPNL